MSPGPRPLAAGALALLAGLCTPVTAEEPPCGATLPAARRQQVAEPGLALAFAPSAWPIPAGPFFTMDVELCRPDEAVLTGVDATMPAHRHGMNYRPRVVAQGGGRFRVEGLLFHMPGRWRLSFELQQGTRARQVSHEVDVP